MEDQHRQLEQRHRASAEQEQQRALEANATKKPLDVWNQRGREMEDGVDPTPEEIEQSGRAAREAQKRHDNLLRRADDAKRRKTEQSGEVGSGGSSFHEQT